MFCNAACREHWLWSKDSYGPELSLGNDTKSKMIKNIIIISRTTELIENLDFSA